MKEFKDTIQKYLEQRVAEDPLFAPKFENPKKNIDVYQSGYYRRPECLILSAKDTAGKRLETIEVNLKTLDIVQSRSFCNGVSEYHDQIVKLVKKNMNLIRQKLIA